GARHKPAMYRSINIERARKPKLKNRRGLASGKVAGIPAVVKGPKAHPPKKEKIWAEKINKKEKRMAIMSSIAATVDPKLVKARGHFLPDNLSLPIVFESKLENLSKTKEVLKAFEAIGIEKDIERVKRKKSIRAGKGKKRGRKYKERKSLLVVVEKDVPLIKAVRNLEGVDVVRVSQLNVSLLAPGALPGRLVVWTEGAIKALENK
ncbi:MAG: 50S ribosomal protein L4, partial [Candidatus Diapherotrites archaeon]